jgi:hypothetical protein
MKTEPPGGGQNRTALLELLLGDLGSFSSSETSRGVYKAGMHKQCGNLRMWHTSLHVKTKKSLQGTEWGRLRIWIYYCY